MAQLAIAIVSLCALTLGASLAARLLRLAICPVCAGVVGTWLWLLAARATGIMLVDPVLLAALLGGSAVGVAQSVNARLPEGRSPQFWKALMLVGGFALAYAVALEHWELAVVAGAQFAVTALLALGPWSVSARDEQAVARIAEGMKKCC